MSELLGLVVAAVAAFAATNIDDILVLTALFGLTTTGGPLRGRRMSPASTSAWGRLWP